MNSGVTRVNGDVDGIKILLLPRAREARKRPARGHSHNGPWNCRHTHTHVDTQKKEK